MLEAQISLIGQQGGKIHSETYHWPVLAVFRSFILVFGAIKLWKMLFIRLFLGNKTGTPSIFTSQTCRSSLTARFTWTTKRKQNPTHSIPTIRRETKPNN